MRLLNICNTCRENCYGKSRWQNTQASRVTMSDDTAHVPLKAEWHRMSRKGSSCAVPR